MTPSPRSQEARPSVKCLRGLCPLGRATSNLHLSHPATFDWSRDDPPTLAPAPDWSIIDPLTYRKIENMHRWSQDAFLTFSLDSKVRITNIYFFKNVYAKSKIKIILFSKYIIV